MSSLKPVVRVEKGTKGLRTCSTLGILGFINDVGNVASSREIIVGTGSIGLQRGSNVEKV